MARSGRRTGRSLNRVTRQRILAVATHLFAEKGLAETSMRDIAVEAGVGLPSVFMSYSSKDELFGESLRTEISKLTEVSAGTGASFGTSQFVQSALRYIHDDPTPWTLYLQATRMSSLADEVGEIREGFVERLDPSLHELMHVDIHSSWTATALVGAWEAIATQVATGGSDLETAAAAIADFAARDVEEAALTPASARPEQANIADQDEALRGLIERARIGISDAWAQAMTKYGVVSAGTLVQMAGAEIDPLAAEQELIAQVRDGVLLGLTVGDIQMRSQVVMFPAFQFDADGHPLPVMSEIATRLTDTWDTESRLLWLTSPNGWLGAQAPADLLADRPEAVLRALDLATTAA